MAARPHDRGRPRARLGERVASSAGPPWLARALSLLTAAALVAWPRAALADDAQELELGKNRFDAGQYEEASKRFTTMLDPAVPPCDKEAPRKSGRCRLTEKDLVEQARAFAAASLVALKRVPEADAQIEKLVRANPSFTPNPALFPAEVIDRFTEVKGRLRAELEAIARKEAEAAYAKQVALQKAKDDEKAWLTELERLAGQERVIERNSRLIAALPFGVGQFQNGDRGLGAFFAVSEALVGSASIAFAGAAIYYQGIDPKGKDENGAPVDLPAVNSAIRTSALLNRITFATWAALTIGGVLQAQIAFVPERTSVVPRPVPKRPPPAVLPTVSLTPGSFGVGVVGVF